MKNLLKTIALIFGIGQSHAQPNVYYHYDTCSTSTKTVYHNGKMISHEVINTPDITTPKILTKKEFVAFMASKNIICL